MNPAAIISSSASRGPALDRGVGRECNGAGLNVLLVEDDPDMNEALSELLVSRGFRLTSCVDGLDALRLARRRAFDAIVLDLSLPGLDGLELLQRIRNDASETPVLVVTARGAVGERVLGLNAGADDYVAKPFDVDELEARLRALIRRRGGERALYCGQLRFDAPTGAFFNGHRPMMLSPREAALLRQLMARRGQAVSKDVLQSAVFGDEVPNPSAVEVLVHRLRKRLLGSAVDLVTLRGVGYLLLDEALARSPESPGR